MIFYDCLLPVQKLRERLKPTYKLGEDTEPAQDTNSPVDEAKSYIFFPAVWSKQVVVLVGHGDLSIKTG